MFCWRRWPLACPSWRPTWEVCRKLSKTGRRVFYSNPGTSMASWRRWPDWRGVPNSGPKWGAVRGRSLKKIIRSTAFLHTWRGFTKWPARPRAALDRVLAVVRSARAIGQKTGALPSRTRTPDPEKAPLFRAEGTIGSGLRPLWRHTGQRTGRSSAHVVGRGAESGPARFYDRRSRADPRDPDPRDRRKCLRGN